MKILLRFSSNPLQIKEENIITLFGFNKVLDLKNLVYPDIPNKFKNLKYERKSLSDDKLLIFYNISSDSELEMSIQDEILIIFKNLKKTYEMSISTKILYTYETLLHELKELYNLEKLQSVICLSPI